MAQEIQNCELSLGELRGSAAQAYNPGDWVEDKPKDRIDSVMRRMRTKAATNSCTSSPVGGNRREEKAPAAVIS